MKTIFRYNDVVLIKETVLFSNRTKLRKLYVGVNKTFHFSESTP